MLIKYNKLRIYDLSLCIMGKYIYFCICVPKLKNEVRKI